MTAAQAPRLFWCSGGDVMMRLEGCAMRLGADEQTDLLTLFDDERRAAADHPEGMQSDAWIASMRKHNELSVARAEAGKWARAARVVR